MMITTDNHTISFTSQVWYPRRERSVGVEYPTEITATVVIETTSSPPGGLIDMTGGVG